MQQARDRLECTRIVIAQRIGTVAGADLILVMEEGRICEQGTPAELLVRGGRYAEMVSMQQI